MKALITAENIKKLNRDGSTSLVFSPRNMIITPEARDIANKLGVAIVDDSAADDDKFPATDTVQEIAHAVSDKLPKGKHDPLLLQRLVQKAMRELLDSDTGPSCDREVSDSGIVLVHGNSVKFGNFDGAPDKSIGLTDVVTSADKSSIAAGFMSWEKSSFPWTLTYDEIDIVLEGELHITSNGTTTIGKPGDVFYIPKGSDIEFGTPNKVRFVYVTYPADWAES